MADKFQIDIFADVDGTWFPGDKHDFLLPCREYLVCLAEALQRAGNGVTVFWDSNDLEYNAVRYRRRSHYDGKSQVMIGFCSPNAFPAKARSDVVVYRPDSLEPWAKDVSQFYSIVDLIVTQSTWQSDAIGPVIAKAIGQDENGVPSVDMVNIPPGIDRDEFSFTEEINREKHQCLYAAPWSRGLKPLLSFWPKIKKEFKSAKLFVTYGCENSARESMASEQSVRLAFDKGLKQPGVIDLGVMSRKELARLYLESDVLTYPCRNEDTVLFGSSVFKAQYAGCVPVTTDVGALPETNRMGICASPKEWFDSAIALLENENLKTALRAKAKEQMIFPTWDEVAHAWCELIAERAKALK